METFSGLLALCDGNSLVTGEVPSQRPVTWSFDVFSDPQLNKRLSTPSRHRWFEKPSGSLWRHCNECKILFSDHWHYFDLFCVFCSDLRVPREALRCGPIHSILAQMFIISLQLLSWFESFAGKNFIDVKLLLFLIMRPGYLFKCSWKRYLQC